MAAWQDTRAHGSLQEARSCLHGVGFTSLDSQLDLLHQQRQVSACREGHHPELVREILNDLEGLGAD